MKRTFLCFAGLMLLLVAPGSAQQTAVVSPPENIVFDGVPPVPSSIADLAGRYGENRSAFPSDWHP